MRLRQLAAAGLFCMGAALIAHGQDNALPPEYEPAIENMDRQPEPAEALMRTHQDVWLAKLDLMLFLHGFRATSPERDSEINRLSQAIAQEAWTHIPENSAARLPGRPPVYDGTSKSLIPTLQLASLSGIANENAFASYLIPCPVLLKRPDLLDAAKAMFGSSLDNHTPRSGCEWGRGAVEGFPVQAVAAFRDLADEADVIYLPPLAGSIRYGMAKQQSYLIERIKLKLIQIKADSVEMPVLQSPYKAWGYLSLYNHRLDQRIGESYIKSVNDIARYYGEKTPATVQAIANALKSVALGACPSAPHGDSLREALLDGAAAGAIEAKLAAISSASMSDESALESKQVLACATDAGIDPIMHIAVARPDVLALIAAHPLIGGVDRRNDFGKTPLMTAAQFDLLPAVTWLLANKADVGATTEATEEGADIKHGQRTALHYAAANAGLPVIEALLRAGADPAVKDDEGATPLDYLNGKGPVPPNPHLAGAELDRVRGLLGKH
ncbi:ankyrin repeat domain-containing protein [Niveispirillum sp. BGYR6]|uniref:ankyrin repeat domain-containing protein n=1 Tax=Niveispirillum sp. BGYR6 TaxID=2971249 RepID=UPI0022B9C443|nr:ankyrin repeat domain-containing protein [Niveispirillum sp. BGYR6]MDG5495984.1 ankyrin repeat domain-containing protein [Niveispirillum sp. BGYR6]